MLKPSERNVVCFYCTESMQYKALKKLTIRRYSGQPARVQITSQISQKESQWRQGRHGKIYKTLFKEGPHQSKFFHYVIDVIHYLLINKLNPARKKNSPMFLPSSAASTFFQRVYCHRRRQGLFLLRFSRHRGRQTFFFNDFAASSFLWHDCAAFGGAKIRKRRRINFHKKRSFSYLGKSSSGLHQKCVRKSL